MTLENLPELRINHVTTYASNFFILHDNRQIFRFSFENDESISDVYSFSLRDPVDLLHAGMNIYQYNLVLTTLSTTGAKKGINDYIWNQPNSAPMLTNQYATLFPVDAKIANF